MCGRFTLKTPLQILQEHFLEFDLPDFAPRYNIAPSQPILTIRQLAPEAKPQGEFLQWGLVPSWADDPKIGNRLINARSDTVAAKPSFRAAFKKRRCLILADGFYEWKQGGEKKVPYHLRMKDGKPFAFAGLWEHWRRDEKAIDSCTILTTEANAVLAPLHDRMPVILRPRDFALWLDPSPKDPGLLQEMLVPYEPEAMIGSPVTTYVNNPRHEDARCLEPDELSTIKPLF